MFISLVGVPNNRATIITAASRGSSLGPAPRGLPRPGTALQSRITPLRARLLTSSVRTRVLPRSADAHSGLNLKSRESAGGSAAPAAARFARARGAGPLWLGLPAGLGYDTPRRPRLRRLAAACGFCTSPASDCARAAPDGRRERASDSAVVAAATPGGQGRRPRGRRPRKAVRSGLAGSRALA